MSFENEYIWRRWLKWIIPAAIILILALVLIGQYNALATANNNVQGKWSQVDVVLQMRADKIPALVAVVKGYATHEETTFTDIANARANLVNARDPAQKATASDQLSNSMGRLVILAESYPQLKADTQFIGLMDEISGTENRLAIARRDYNQSVTDFNNQISGFPGNITARFLGFGPKQYFQPTGSTEMPKIDFGK